MLTEELECMTRLDDLREKKEADGRVLVADRLRRACSLVRLRRWHPDIDDRDVWFCAPDCGLERASVRRLRHHFEAAIREDAREPLPEEDGIVGDHDSHGISPTTRVPPPGGLSTVSLPPRASTRSSRPLRPDPL